MKVVLKKVPKSDIAIIQNEVFEFYEDKVKKISKADFNNYCNDLIVIENLNQMLFYFRNIIEKNKPIANLSFTLSQAVILIYTCQNNCNSRNQTIATCMQLLSDELHKQLINI